MPLSQLDVTCLDRHACVNAVIHITEIDALTRRPCYVCNNICALSTEMGFDLLRIPVGEGQNP